MKHRDNKFNFFSVNRELSDSCIGYSFQSEISHLADFFDGKNRIKEFMMLLDSNNVFYNSIDGAEFENRYFEDENKYSTGQCSRFLITTKDASQILVILKCIEKLKFSGSCTVYFWMEAAEIERLKALEQLSGIPIWIAFRDVSKVFSFEQEDFYFVSLCSIVDFWKELSLLYDSATCFHDINVLRIPNDILIESDKKKLFNHKRNLEYSVLDFFRKKNLDHFGKLKKQLAKKNINKIESMAFFYKENKGCYCLEEIKFHLHNS
jgi:hypothetical protein